MKNKITQYDLLGILLGVLFGMVGFYILDWWIERRRNEQW
jgi:hypothetical protein